MALPNLEPLHSQPEKQAETEFLGNERPAAPLSTKGLWMHAWDLLDNGADKVMGWMSDSGLNLMCMASCYHSGWFVHPHSSRRRVYMTEGSVAYFHPDEKLYTHTPLRPQLASFAKKTNRLSVAAERLDKYGLKLVSWTIGVHNTELGRRYPHQQNVYGDSIPHALSIGHDATREYLKALCRDLATNYPLDHIYLESFGWMGLHHGHHHDRDLLGLTPLEQQLLSMCFNPQTVKKAQAKGVDAEKAREVVKAVLDNGFREAPDRPKGHPRSMADLEERSPDLKAYNRLRHQLYLSLHSEIKHQALKDTSCKLLLNRSRERELAELADGFLTGVDPNQPERVLVQIRQDRASLPNNWSGGLPFQINLRSGSPASKEQLRHVIMAAKERGATGPIFYNYSESPAKILGWIKPSLQGL